MFTSRSKLVLIRERNPASIPFSSRVCLRGGVPVYLRECRRGWRYVPCAVCYVPAAILMIPAKTTCPPSWTLQYSGFLTTNSDDFKSSSDYVCMDDNPQYIEGSRDNRDGKLFYPVHARCGALPCPPYVNDAYLRCCVCSK